METLPEARPGPGPGMALVEGERSEGDDQRDTSVRSRYTRGP